MSFSCCFIPDLGRQNFLSFGAEMKILFSEIPEEGVEVEIDNQDWFPSDSYSKDGDAKFEMALYKKDKVRVFVKGKIEVALKFDCDRCLERFLYPIQSDFNVNIELVQDGLDVGCPREYHCKDTEMDVVYVQEAKIDVNALLKEQISLALPGKRLCDESCLGLCINCGTNLNISSCSCSGGKDESPFKVLEKIIK